MRRQYNKKYLIVLTIIILLQLFRITYVFAFEREGFHSDESWSYGFANSYYNPYIHKEVGEDVFLSDAEPVNMNEWVSGEVFRDYLTVNEGEEFSYDSVYYNVEGDTTPPLYYMVLHTICSFFPGRFSWYFAFGINVGMFILCQMVLYKLACSVTKTEWMGILTCGYYGFSSGALNCFVYLRMYALLTLWGLLFTYLLHAMYQKNFLKITRECILTVMVTILGALTHYYYLVFAFFVTAFTCFFLLVKKKGKQLALYAGTMLIGVSIYFLIFPFAIWNMLNGTEIYKGGFHFPYYWNLSACLSFLLEETLGITWKINHITLLYIVIGLFWTAVVAALLGFLFRKENWLINLMGKCQNWGRDWRQRFLPAVRKCSWFAVSWCMAVVLTTMVIAKISYVERMGIYTDRYLFFLMPMTICLFLWLVKTICQRIGKKKVLAYISMWGVIATFFLMNQLRSRCNYLFPTGVKELPLYEQIAGADCIIVTEADWRLTWYAGELYNANAFFAVQGDECMSYTTALEEYNVSDRPVYLIVEKGAFKKEDVEVNSEGAEVYDAADAIYGLKNEWRESDFIAYLHEEVDWIENVEYLYERDSFCGLLHIYLLNE